MSGTPRPEQVATLMRNVRLARKAREEIISTKAKITELQKSLKEFEEVLFHAETNIKELMKSMDVHAPGNFGWEARMVSFLTLFQEYEENYAGKSPVQLTAQVGIPGPPPKSP